MEGFSGFGIWKEYGGDGFWEDGDVLFELFVWDRYKFFKLFSVMGLWMEKMKLSIYGF